MRANKKCLLNKNTEGYKIRQLGLGSKMQNFCLVQQNKCMVLVHKKTKTIPKTIFVDPQKLSLKKEKGKFACSVELDILPCGADGSLRRIN